jgi:hypothetical protein
MLSMELSGCRLLALISILFCITVSIAPASADVSIPAKTTVLIDQGGEPFTGPVFFNVSCYGYLCKDYACRPDPAYSERDPHNAAPVFAYSASCPVYGCTIYQPFYLNHRHIAWCDLAGTANGTPFTIPNFSASPVPDCTYDMQIDMSENDTYYRYPPAYRACREEKEQEKKDLCGKYITPITWAEIEKSTGLSWFANNGTYWVRTDAYLACISRLDQEGSDCGADHPLEKVDQSMLERDPQGNLIGSFCTLRIALPTQQSGNQTPRGLQDPATISPPDGGTMNLTFGKQASTTVHEINPVESLYCTLLNVFGASC